MQGQGSLDIREAFIDGSFVLAKRGGIFGRTNRGKGTKIMAIAAAVGLPVAACLESISTHEVKLAETALDSLFIAGKPEKFIGDKASDRESSTMIS